MILIRITQLKSDPKWVYSTEFVGRRGEDLLVDWMVRGRNISIFFKVYVISWKVTFLSMGNCHVLHRGVWPVMSKCYWLDKLASFMYVHSGKVVFKLPMSGLYRLSLKHNLKHCNICEGVSSPYPVSNLWLANNPLPSCRFVSKSLDSILSCTETLTFDEAHPVYPFFFL